MPPPQKKLKTDNSAMKFKAKIRKIGNSFGVIIPKNVITNFTPNEEIELDVITKDDIFNETPPKVITSIIDNETEKFTASSRFELCSKHKGSMKATCGCK